MKKNLKYLLPLATLLLLLSACQEPEMEVFSSRSLSRVLARRSGKPSSSSS